MLTDVLSNFIKQAFTRLGYDEKYGGVVRSQRPDLCQFQCNGAMSASKEYKKAPFIISDEVIAELKSFEGIDEIIEFIETVKPGFINITLKDSYLANHMNHLASDPRVGCEIVNNPLKIIMDYGGPNIAKPLHVGHLRSAIIGESLKRLMRFLGHDVIADTHLGDWGLQMGMIISECERRYAGLPYFDDAFLGEYPTEPPFSLDDLAQIYPYISKLSKEDENVLASAKEATFKLQNGSKGYLALWQHIVDVSLNDIKINYKRLNVDFDLWYGESHSNPFVSKVVNHLENKEVVYESEGALVVDILTTEDEQALPPLLLYKTDGSILYTTTDLATLYQRMEDFNPDIILYVVDNRQSTHFKQVFLCAYQNGIVPEKTSLEHIGFGTMNGKDGKPFKTRDGGTIKLSELIDMVEANAREKVRDKEDLDVNTISKQIGLATLKFADLSNFRTKDYVFDLEKFSSFEGKTGPYLLYSYVRLNNIIKKLQDLNITPSNIALPASEVERNIFLKLNELPEVLNLAAKDRAPSIVCEYVYDLSTLVNAFYHTHHILNQEDVNQQKSWMALCQLIITVMNICLNILGIEVPEKM
ncbi:MAG: arginine--tRNA ligase [Firmicutes bacterium HGW-Firmicutes-1]|jgi:arginyl-tRNA synthetase|nr:MAG: arginine--tRNA ligase [Firmicutes bacterium HGW-Firmicutes-1]